MLSVCIAYVTIVPQQIALSPGARITTSAKVAPHVYKLPSAGHDGSSAALTIEGHGITIDFMGATLEGTPQSTRPDERKGTGVIVKGSNITIKNLKVRGYRHGLIARSVPNLRILNSDFSYNWKQHLASTLEREDTSDWMSFHHNEKDEWLRYGEGIYLRDCDNFEIKDCTAVGGQSGLMLTQCDGGKVWNCNFSFLSALGIGMYRSSDNKIMHNNIDWCVRGFSYGVYNRGQDSAGILVYEQSDRNVFAYNSVTHGGDGFFLWAGQTTMDTGKGGCNDNILYGNDFSHAPTNGIEATFSRNKFINNLIMECWHGIWGGYSYDSEVRGNVFAFNEEAIAWEHGQDNKVIGNRFYRNNDDIVIWSNATQDPNWGYPKNRDTRSRDWLIKDNFIGQTAGTVFRIARSRSIRLENNALDHVSHVDKLGEAVEYITAKWKEVLAVNPSGLAQGDNVKIGIKWAPLPRASSLSYSFSNLQEYLGRFNVLLYQTSAGHAPPVMWAPITRPQGAIKTMKGGKEPFLPPGTLRGWRYILVDEWGPYDFKSPKLWPRGKTKDGALLFEILGPKGKWNAKAFHGGKLSAMSGDVPGFVEVTLNPGKATDLLLDFEYKGGEVITPFGEKIGKGRAYRFTYRKFFAPIAWTVKWFRYDKATQEPRTMPEAFAKVLRGAPIKTVTTDVLDYAWGGAIGEGLPSDYFATVADGTFEVPAGEYFLKITSDDGVRVFLDGEKVFDDWTWHAPKQDEVKVSLTGGEHKIRVEHFEIDGYSTLKLSLEPSR